MHYQTLTFNTKKLIGYVHFPRFCFSSHFSPNFSKILQKIPIEMWLTAWVMLTKALHNLVYLVFLTVNSSDCWLVQTIFSSKVGFFSPLLKNQPDDLHLLAIWNFGMGDWWSHFGGSKQVISHFWVAVMRLVWSTLLKMITDCPEATAHHSAKRDPLQLLFTSPMLSTVSQWGNLCNRTSINLQWTPHPKETASWKAIS